MGHQDWLADAPRAWGLTVVECNGWQTRGSSDFNPQGGVAHHTAGPTGSGDMPSLNTLINGRPDLAGPLANWGLGRSGTVYVIAAGRANHAGKGGWKGLSGNSSVLGIEAENDGYQDWPQAQLDAYSTLCAAACAATGISPDMWCRHHEWRAEKPDPHDIDGDAARAAIAARLAAGPQEADMSYTDDDRARDDQVAATAIATGPMGVTLVQGRTTVFWIDDTGRLVHRWYDVAGRWQVDYPMNGLDPERGVAVVPDNAGLAQVFAFDRDGNVRFAQYNPAVGRWETDRLTAG